MKIVLLTTRLNVFPNYYLCDALNSFSFPVFEVVCARNPKEGLLRYRMANNRLFRTVKSGLDRKNHINSNSNYNLKRYITRGMSIKSFPRSFDDPKVVNYLHSLNPDILVHIYGPIFRPAIIETARIGVINCHMGLLPEFRGMNAAEWSVLYGYPTGNTIHFIDQGIDTGDILQFFQVDVSDCRSINAMRAKLVSLQYGQIGLAIKMLAEGKLYPVSQSFNQGRQYFKMHHELSAKVEDVLAQGYHPRVNIEGRGYAYQDDKINPKLIKSKHKMETINYETDHSKF